MKKRGKKRINRTLYWAPRILSILLILFTLLLTTDVFGEYTGTRLLAAFFMHAIPSIVMIIALIVAWKWELVGGILMVLLAVFSAFFFHIDENLMVIPIIILPLLIIAALFIINYCKSR